MAPAKGGYALLRTPADRFGNRRVTQRNLQSTLTWLDFQNPAASRLLNAAATPHGAALGAAFDPQSSRFRQLVAWVAVVTQRPLETPPEAAGHGESERRSGQRRFQLERRSAADRRRQSRPAPVARRAQGPAAGDRERASRRLE